MAEIKSTATAASKKTAQPQEGGNLIATLAPIACIVLGYVIWRFVLGNGANFTNPDPNGWILACTQRTKRYIYKNV